MGHKHLIPVEDFAPKTKDSRLADFLAGLVIGLLLALNGCLFLHDRFCHADGTPVKVVTVTKKVVRTRTVNVEVERVVNTERIVKEAKLYRASKLDANGNVIESWEVTKCRFRVIGARLTDKDGRTFDVVGNIKIDPIQ
jgi:hypothetical protein